MGLRGYGGTDPLVEETVEVASRQITVQPYVITRATFDWTIELQSTDTCAAVNLALLHDDAAVAGRHAVPRFGRSSAAPGVRVESRVRPRSRARSWPG